MAVGSEFEQWWQDDASVVWAYAARRVGRVVAAVLLCTVVAGCAHGSGSAQQPGAGTSLPAGTGTRLPIVASHEAVPLYLPDGTPVWEVRHSDGSFSVLGAAVTPSTDGRPADGLQPLPGIRVMTAWDRAARRFIGDGLRDEHGRALGYLHPMVGGNPALPTAAPDMTIYAIRRSGKSLVVGKPTEGTVRHFDAHHSIGPGGASPVDRFISFDPGRTGRHTGSLQEAAAGPDGTMSLVDASLIVDRDQPPRLCSTGQRFDHVPFSPCPSTAPVATGVHPQATDNAISAIPGPLLLRFRHGEFYDVTAFGNGAAGFYYLVNGDEPAPAD